MTSEIDPLILALSQDAEILDASSGLSKRVIAATPLTEAPRPDSPCKVWLHFRGYYAAAADAPRERWALFEDTWPRPAPLIITVGKEETIPGLEAALSAMREGERGLVAVPPSQAFGAMGNPMGFHGSGQPIPADSHLFFDVQLLLTERSLEPLQTAAQLKEEANRRFSLRLFAASQLLYQRALELLSQQQQADSALRAALTSNLMAALLKGGHCEEARKLGEEFMAGGEGAGEGPLGAKIAFRLASAHVGLGRWTDAAALLGSLLQRQDLDGTMRAEAERAAQLAQGKLQQLARAEQGTFSGLFERMAEDPAAAELYPKDEIAARLEDDRQSKMRECPFCHEQIDHIQYPRHIIKFHSNEK